MGIIFDIQRCSYHDGPGIRTTVFFKGCQLRCAWCHNPESFLKQPQLQYFSHLCTGCRACEQVCPHQIHSFDKDGIHKVRFADCISCGACITSCPSQALKIIGREMTAAQVMKTVLRDRSFYLESGGGLTVSGGEPTMQPEFLLELLTLAKEENIHTCLETNGYIPEELLGKLLPCVDLFLLDYKITGEQELFKYTHASGHLWQNTLNVLEASHIPVILRLPIIPNINDTDFHFKEAAQFKKAYSCIREVEIMPYHSIGAAKWEQLGLCYSLTGLANVTPEQKASWNESLEHFLNT